MNKVLYVEDNKDTADAVKVILDAEGFDTTISGSGKDALKRIKTTKYDIIILDIMLPDMSGWDIFTKLKGKVTSSIVFLSAIPVSSERMAELKRVGIADYITKPFERINLVNRIKKVVRAQQR